MGSDRDVLAALMKRKQELQEYADACAALGSAVPPELYDEYVTLELKIKELEQEQENT